MIALNHVLVATDFGDSAEVALRYGRELARTFGATLHIVHVVDDLGSRVAEWPGYVPNFGRLQTQMEETARQKLEALVSDEDRRDLRARTTAVTSAATAEAILTYARDHHVDVIVAGTHGRGAVRRFFMGSVAERILRNAPCPVLTVRFPEHDFVLPDALEAVAAR
jgi:nucleotide-binding universal stress UspA family protein